ncbi:MAG: hypothetical protein NUW23_02710 [Firmicutes bacterium]|nr:hypothetical protein [Bacillota bacterium]
MFELLGQKYQGVNYGMYHLIRNLLYSDDADREPDPLMRVEMSWDEIKEYFRRLQRMLMERYLPTGL